MNIPKKIAVNAMIFSGFTFVEILLSMAFCTFLLLIFSHIVNDFYHHHQKIKEQQFLQQEAHQIMHYLRQHIQHIGYLGQNRESTNMSLFLDNGKSYHLAKDQQCFTFIYDLDGDGCIGSQKGKQLCRKGELSNVNHINKEIFGFKLHQKEIQIYTPANRTFNQCTQAVCQTLLTDCNHNWSILGSGKHRYQTDLLRFHWIKPDQLLQIDLRLLSNKFQHISYSLTAYVALLNSPIFVD